jgi:hypothetical protein
MVGTMTDAYNALTEEDQGRVFMLAVGLDMFSNANQNFCQGGFGMCPDDSSKAWWTLWGAKQRDVYFFYKNSQDEWKHYCHFSLHFSERLSVRFF